MGITHGGDSVAGLRNNLRELAGAARSNVWVLAGTEAASGTPLRILFAGGDRQRDYWSRLAFAGDCTETPLGKVYLWQLLYLLRRNSQRCDLAVIEGRGLQRRLYQGVGDFYLPLWVDSSVELPLTPASKGAKEDLRRIRKHQLGYELTKDTQLLREFYDHMYLPTVRDRHGEQSHISRFEELARSLGRGDNQLLLVRHEGVAIAGVIIIKSAVPRLWLAGIRDSSMAYRRMGAVGATYHFPAQALAAEGFKRMDMGRSRPFFNDGVMNYKGKWNHRLDGFDSDGMVLRVLAASAAARGLLARQPFAHLQDGRLHGAVFVDDAHSPPAESAAKEVASLRALAGLAGVTVFALDAATGKPHRLAR